MSGEEPFAAAEQQARDVTTRSLAYRAGFEAGLLLARVDRAGSDEEELLGCRLVAAWWERFVAGYEAGGGALAVERLMTLAEAAAELGISVQAVASAVDAGRLTSMTNLDAPPRQGRRLVLRDEVARWKQAREG